MANAGPNTNGSQVCGRVCVKVVAEVVVRACWDMGEGWGEGKGLHPPTPLYTVARAHTLQFFIMLGSTTPPTTLHCYDAPPLAHTCGSSSRCAPTVPSRWRAHLVAPWGRHAHTYYTHCTVLRHAGPHSPPRRLVHHLSHTHTHARTHTHTHTHTFHTVLRQDPPPT